MMIGSKQRLLGLALVAAVIVLAAPAAAEEPLPAKAYFSPMVIPAAAFINDGVDPDGFDFRTGGIEGKNVEANMTAPVYLPNDAIISSFRAYIYDNYDGQDPCGTNYDDVEIFLVRTSMVDGATQLIAATVSEGASGNVDFEETFLLNTGFAKVNNNSYQYFIHMRICRETSHRLNAVVIEF